jgi:dihydrofolate reductase
MGKLVISENVTLDLMVQDSAGDVGWYTRIPPVDQEGFAAFFSAEARDASALLMGRRSYEWFAARWLTRTGAWASRLASMPKYVVSSTLTDLPWGNTTVIGLDEVPSLKDDFEGDVVVNGSGRLTKTLFDKGWADSLRLLVYPYVLGSGEPLPSPGALTLVSHSTVGEGLMALTYSIE